MAGTTSANFNYLRTLPGILKICALLAGSLGIICILCGLFSKAKLHNFRAVFFMTIALLGIACTASVLVARIYQLWKYKFYSNDMVKFELYLHAGLTAGYFIAAVIALTLDLAAYSAAAFFGFLAAIFYGVDCYLCYRRSRQRDAVTQT